MARQIKKKRRPRKPRRTGQFAALLTVALLMISAAAITVLWVEVFTTRATSFGVMP